MISHKTSLIPEIPYELPPSIILFRLYPALICRLIAVQNAMRSQNGDHRHNFAFLTVHVCPAETFGDTEVTAYLALSREEQLLVNSLIILS